MHVRVDDQNVVFSRSSVLLCVKFRYTTISSRRNIRPRFINHSQFVYSCMHEQEPPEDFGSIHRSNLVIFMQEDTDEDDVDNATCMLQATPIHHPCINTAHKPHAHV